MSSDGFAAAIAVLVGIDWALIEASLANGGDGDWLGVAADEIGPVPAVHALK